MDADLYCALAVSDTGAAGLWLDLDTDLCRYYRRPLPPPLAFHPDPTAVAAANVAAGVQHWAAGWSDDDLAAVVFSDCALVEPLSPYRLTGLTQPGEPCPTELGQLSTRHHLRKKLKTLLEEYDITLQYVTPEDHNEEDDDGDVPKKDRRALATGASLLSAATWLAHHVNADVEAVEDRIREAVGDGCDLEVEANRSTSEPADSLFE